MAYNRGRKNVTWKDDAARIPQKRPHPHLAEVPLASDRREEYAVALVPGTLWTVTQNLGRNMAYDGLNYSQHEIPYIAPVYYGYEPAVTTGTTAVYLGTTRVEEASGRTNGVVSVLRHTFLIGSQRWLCTDLNLFSPITLTV